MDTPKVIEIISNTISIDKSKITPETKVADLQIDSLDIVELALAFEAELETEIPDEDIGNFKTVQNIIDYINKIS